MADVPGPPDGCPQRFNCGWRQYPKHLAARGVTRDDTRHGPAMYLPGTTFAAIQLIETETVKTPSRVLSVPPNAEYARQMPNVIGWDAGVDATVSFVECSGGTVAGRGFHGRPMAVGNHKLRK